jgi:hypothetical protein
MLARISLTPSVRTVSRGIGAISLSLIIIIIPRRHYCSSSLLFFLAIAKREATKQSILALRRCGLLRGSLSSGAHSRDPFARNVET